MLFNFFERPTTSLLLFADNDNETSTYKRELSQKMLISARQKDETSKLMVHTIERRNEMNVNIFEVPVIDEK